MTLETTTTTPAAADLPRVEVWTDGSCRPNPGVGGFAAVLRNETGDERELTGWLRHGTNNQAELMGATAALEYLSTPRRVILHTDSEYLQLGGSRRFVEWRAAGWKTAKGKPIANREQWERLMAAASRHVVEWRWVGAHGDDAMNNRVDELATRARDKPRGESGSVRIRRVPSTPSASEADPQ